MIHTIFNLFLLSAGSLIAIIILILIFSLISENRKKVKKLIIINPPQKITFNNSVKFEVKGVDSNNKETQLYSIKWEINQGGKIDNKGKFIAGNKPQKVKITASKDKVQKTIEIEIIEPELKVFKLTAQRYTAKPQDNIKLDIQCKDQLNYPLKIENITWSQNADYTINSLGNLQFKSQVKGDYIIKATAVKYNKNDSIKINIPPVLTTIKINAQSLAIKPEEESKFTVTGYDQRGDKFEIKKVRWTCTEGGKINSDTGIFLGNYQSKKATIIAQVDNIKDSVIIDLLPVLYKIKINSPNSKIKPNEKIQFRATGLDQFGCEIALNNIEWNADQGSIDNDGNYQGLSYETEVKITVKSGKITSSTRLLIRKPSVLTKLDFFIRFNF